MSAMASARAARGFSLVELLVATAIGLVVMGAVTVGFVGSSNARRSADQASQQVESGRYAMQLLSEELQLAGYYAEFDPCPMAPPAA
jgi:type IV pilus assembly protein PilW